MTVTVSGSSFTNDPGGLISGYGTFNTSGVSLTNNGIIDLSPPSILGVDSPAVDRRDHLLRHQGR